MGLLVLVGLGLGTWNVCARGGWQGFAGGVFDPLMRLARPEGWTSGSKGRVMGKTLGFAYALRAVNKTKQ